MFLSNNQRIVGFLFTLCLVQGGCGAQEQQVEELSSEVTQCSGVRCGVGTRCVSIGERTACIPLFPCQQTMCSGSQHCELQKVECVMAPCMPQPICVEGTNPCSTVKCAAESLCVAVGGKPYCVKKP